MDGAGETAGRYLTKRQAEAWLREVLDQARRGTLPVRTGATFADAYAEYPRYVEHDRGRELSTVRGYRSVINTHLLPAFGSTSAEEVTTAVFEERVAGYEGSPPSRNKLLIQLHGVLGRAKKVYGLAADAAVEVEKFQQRPRLDPRVGRLPVSRGNEQFEAGRSRRRQ